MWAARLTGVPVSTNDKAVTLKGKHCAFDSLDHLTRDSSEIPDCLIDVYTFDATSHRWDILQAHSLPDDRPINNSGRSIVAYGHSAYIWGGWHENPNAQLSLPLRYPILDMEPSEGAGDVPKARICRSACVLGCRMYISRGFGTEPPGYIRFLDLESLKWHCVRTSGEGSAERCCHTASAIGTRMYVWGGSLNPSLDDERYDNYLYYLETKTAAWVRPLLEGVASEGRELHCAFVYDRALYIFGGYNVLLDAFFGDMHKYELEKSRWVEVKRNGFRPSASCCHGRSVLGERILVFGGFGPAQNHDGEEHLMHNTQEDEGLTDLHVLHLASTLQNLCLLAVIDGGLDVSGAPELIRNEINAITLR